MERDTFADPQVARALADFRLLRADVTANAPRRRVMLKRFGLFGPPGLVFFDAKGHELSAARVIGFVAAPVFHATRRRAAMP